MVAFKLILQSLAGTVAVVGAVGGTFALSNNKTTTQKEEQEEKREEKAETLTLPHSEDYGRPQIKITEVDLNSTNQTSKAFYLVSAALEVADEKPSTDLFDNSKNPKEKNYQCVNSSQTSQRQEEIITKDSSCILYSLKTTKDQSLKISDIKTQTQNETSDFPTKVTTTREILEHKFFLLQANKNLIKYLINNTEPIIYLTIKNTKDFFYQSNYYAMIKVHAKIFNNEVIGLTDTIIAKATSDKQSSTKTLNVSSPSYQCSFKLEDTKTDCMLSKLSAYTSGGTLNFANLPIKNRSETINTEENNYYFIKADEIIPHEVKNLKSSTAKYIETNSENSTTTTTLSIESAVFAKFNNDGTRLTELIILD